MGINLWVLRDDLSEFEPKLFCKKAMTENFLTYFSFFDGENQADNGCLLVVTPEQLAAAVVQPGDSFLCIGEPDFGGFPETASVLWVADKECALPLVAKLARLFHTYNEWFCALERAVDQKKPLDTFGRLSLSVFRRPIALFKYNFFTLFSVYDEAYGPLPENHYHYTVGAYLNAQIMSDIEEDLSAVMAKREPYLHTSTAGISALCFNLWVQDRFIATLQVDELTTPIREREFALISILGEMLLRSITANSLINFSLNSDLQGVIYDLLDHHAVDPHRMEETLQTVGWEPTGTYSCIVCQSVRRDMPENTLFLRGEALSQKFPCSIYVIYQNQILLFCRRDQLDQMAYRNALKELRSLLAEIQFVAGVSNDYEFFDQSGYFYEAAREAILYGKKNHSRQNLYYYEAYMVDIFLERALKDTVQEVYIPQELLRMIRYDRETEGDYCKVLYALLRNNMSCTDAANELFTHRNTVLNRMNRMKEYFHMNLNSFSYRLKLMIALQVLDGKINEE